MDTRTLNLVAEDECCHARLSKALQDGMLAVSWTCHACCSEWRRELHQLDAGEGVYHWYPHVPMLIFRP